MKRIKRRTATYACALATLVWACAPVRAEYKGELSRDSDLTINFDNSAVTGKTAITVFYLGKRPDEIEFTAQPGERVQYIAPKPGKGCSRIIVEVDPPKNGTALVEVGGHPETCNGYTHLVFDIE